MVSAALTVFTRPAQAHHESVWEGTMTPAWLTTSYYGCNNGNSNAANHCSERLNDDDFVFRGRTYYIHQITLGGTPRG